LIDRRMVKKFDFTLFIVTLLIIVFGLIILSSATHTTMTRDGDSLAYVKKQAFSIVLGLSMIVFLLKIDYKEFVKHSKFIYFFNLCIGSGQ